MTTLLNNLQKRLLEHSETDDKAASYILHNPKNEERDSPDITKLCQDKTFNIAQFRTLEQFSKELNAYVNNNKIELHTRKRKHDQLEKKPNNSYLTDSCMCSILQKSLNDKKFWSCNGLKSLIKNKYITSKCEDKMVDCILKYESYEIFETLVQCNVSLTEKNIVKCLKQLISQIDPVEQEKLNGELIWQSCPINIKTAQAILYAMSIPCNFELFKEHMKILSTNEALVLLQLFHYVLFIVSPALIDSKKDDIHVPEFVNETKVLHWIDSIMTAHMVAFTSSNTLTELITQLKNTTAKQRRFYRDISILAPYLDLLQSKKINLPKKCIGSYAVETIVL